MFCLKKKKLTCSNFLFFIHSVLNNFYNLLKVKNKFLGNIFRRSLFKKYNKSLKYLYWEKIYILKIENTKNTTINNARNIFGTQSFRYDYLIV